MGRPNQLKSGANKYRELVNLAKKKGVYENAKEYKVNRKQRAGKSRDEISARPASEDLEKALKQDAGMNAGDVSSSSSTSPKARFSGTVTDANIAGVIYGSNYVTDVLG